jgi:hypothetical protein
VDENKTALFKRLGLVLTAPVPHLFLQEGNLL